MAPRAAFTPVPAADRFARPMSAEVLTARLAADTSLWTKARQDRCERKPGPADLIFTTCMDHCKRRPEAAISKPKERRPGNGSYTPAPAVSNFGCRRMRLSIWMPIPDQDPLT